MSIPNNQLVESALSLPPSDRAGLVLRLLQSLSPTGKEITDEEFSHLLHQRVEEHRSGSGSSISLDEAREAVAKSLAKSLDKRPNA